MKNTDILSRITALLNKKVSLAQQTLDNGTVVESDSFSVGDPIFAIDGENKMPLGIGSYTMEDGSTLEVTEIGIIGEIATAQAEGGEGETEMAEETKVEEKVETELSEVPATLEEIVQAVVNALQPKFDALDLKCQNLSGDQTAMKETLSTTVAKKPLVHKPTEKVALSNLKVGENVSNTEALIMARLSR